MRMRKTAAAFALCMLLHVPATAGERGEFISDLLKLPIPATLELCGEKVPLERTDIVERLDLELVVALANPVSATLWFKRKERYFPYIESMLREKGMPEDLKFVPVIESNLRAEAVSSARAVGPWQFIRSTGKMYGLHRNSWRDDRQNWEKSTAAALKYLRDLYEDFDSWPLAMAAYNAGERRVRNALEKQGQKDFYGLKLPTETERYVFRVMAAKLILQQPEEYGIDLTGARLYPPEDVVTMTLKVKRSSLPISVAAEAAGVSFKRFKSLNPWMRHETFPKGTHKIKVPSSSSEDFPRALASWEKANPAPKVVYHKVRRGDTLSAIADRYGVRLNDLCAWNSLTTRSIIIPGQRIAVRGVN